jgi:DNA-binding response OmpR family regulator
MRWRRRARSCCTRSAGADRVDAGDGVTAAEQAQTIRVLLVEDDDRLGRLTARYLESHGLVVDIATDGATGLAQAVRTPYDAVLLDLMLPRMDGLEVCRELRARCDVPVIMVTARGEEADRVLGLELGADDYIAKPFSSRELLARIRAVVRRARGRAGPPHERLEVGRLVVDTATLRATLDGETLALTTYEFNLLRVLAERAGRVLTREQLLDLVRGTTEEAFDRSIDVHISRLRQKLGDDPRRPELLKTVRGVGYVLADEEPS